MLGIVVRQFMALYYQVSLSRDIFSHSFLTLFSFGFGSHGFATPSVPLPKAKYSKNLPSRYKFSDAPPNAGQKLWCLRLLINR